MNSSSTSSLNLTPERLRFDELYPVTGCEFPGTGSIWPLIVLGLLVFLIWSEDGSQNCKNGKMCNNSAPALHSTDSNRTIIDKINIAIRNNHTLVAWRRVLIASLLIALLVFLFLFDRTYLPHGFVYFITVLIIFVGLYFSSSWIQHSWWRHNNKRIEACLHSLRHSI